MRLKTQKHIRKLVKLYKINYGFKNPYKIILDGNFIKKSMDKQYKFREKIQKYTKSVCILHTTNCVIRELNLLGENFKQVLEEAKSLKRIKCMHDDSFTPRKCFLKLIGKHNEEKYMIATQDFGFKSKLNKIQGVPILFFAQEKLDMTEPSFTNQQKLDDKESKKFLPNQKEMEKIKQVKEEIEKENIIKQNKQIQRNRNELILKNERKAKGPNPLSMKKKIKKVKTIFQNQQNNKNLVKQ